MSNLSAEDRIIRSQVKVLKQFPFFGALLLKLQLKEDNEIGTLGTNGIDLVYSPEYVDTLDEQELNWVIIHETLHPALGHIWRKQDRYHDLWNVACDYEIHSFMQSYLDETGCYDFMKRRPEWLYNKKYDGMSADEIYEELLDDYEKNRSLLQQALQDVLDNHDMWNDSNGSGDGNGNGNEDGEEEGNGNSGGNGSSDSNGNGVSKSDNTLKREWEGAVVQAAQLEKSRGCGKVPSCMERIVKNITEPQKDWRELLAEAIVPIPDDYGFTPPDRRMSDSIFFMPDICETTDTLGKVVFMIDTSGSMGMSDIELVYSEVVGCVNQFNNVEGYIGCFDASIHNVRNISEVEDLKDYVCIGGGGTDFHEVLEYINNHAEMSEGLQAVVILTDGYASFNNLPSLDCELIWIITQKDVVPPVGKVAYLDNKSR